MHMVCGQVNNRQMCVSPSTTLTSSTVETVFRQSLILDWKLEVPGEDKSSFVRTRKSEILIRSGMFRAKRVGESLRRKVSPSFTRAFNSHLKQKKAFTSPLCAPRKLRKVTVFLWMLSPENVFNVESFLKPHLSPGGVWTPLPQNECVRVEVDQRAIVRRRREGANSIITWECLCCRPHWKDWKVCMCVYECVSCTPLFILTSHFYARVCAVVAMDMQSASFTD